MRTTVSDTGLRTELLGYRVDICSTLLRNTEHFQSGYTNLCLHSQWVSLPNAPHSLMIAVVFSLGVANSGDMNDISLWPLFACLSLLMGLSVFSYSYETLISTNIFSW